MTPLFVLILLIVSFLFAQILFKAAQHCFDTGKKIFANVTTRFPTGVDVSQNMLFALDDLKVEPRLRKLLEMKLRRAFAFKVRAFLLSLPSFLILASNVLFAITLDVSLFSGYLQSDIQSITSLLQIVTSFLLVAILVVNSFLFFSSVFWFIRSRGIFAIVDKSTQQAVLQRDG